MLNSHSRYRKPAVEPQTLTVADINRYGDGWIIDCQLRQLSPRTVATRKDTISKLLWFLNDKGYAQCTTLELRNYLAYLATAHKEARGRWGKPNLNQPLRPRSIWDVHNNVRCFFNWMIDEGYAGINPMAAIKPPVCRADQVRPFPNDR